MTDRYHSLLVVLEENIREDDAESILKALGMIRGVIDVSGVIVNPDTQMAEARARHDLRRKLADIVR